MTESRVVRAVVVTNPQGLHARPADMFAKLANQFECRVELVKESERVDGKSILSLLTLAAVSGTSLMIETIGPDAESAAAALAELFERNFDE
jgi:phosphocarrier protein HPr